MKIRWRCFMLAFVCTLLLCCLVSGFAVADANTRETGYGEFVPLWQLEESGQPLHLDLAVFGARYDVSFEWLNTAAGWAQKASPFAPAGARLAVKVGALGARWFGENCLLAG